MKSRSSHDNGQRRHTNLQQFQEKFQYHTRYVHNKQSLQYSQSWRDEGLVLRGTSILSQYNDL